MKLGVAQINTAVGDLEGNLSKILEYYNKACAAECDIVAFPELTVSGYPIQDQVLNKTFLKDVATIVKKAKRATIGKKTAMIIGAPVLKSSKIYNAAFFIENGTSKTVLKYSLPNYGVFDEKRTFSSSRKSKPIEFKGTKIGLLICEDIWNYATPNHLASKGAQILICINSSPYDITKFSRRLDLVSTVQNETHLPILYVNQVGGQDGIVFDGGSFYLDKGNKHLLTPTFWEESFAIIDTSKHSSVKLEQRESTEDLYNALLIGLHDYLAKTAFKKVILGSSGGMDSALVATLAVDAFGSENVHAVMLRSKFTSKESLEDAATLSNNLLCKHSNLSIADVYSSMMSELSSELKNTKVDITEENLQARIRGVMLMALSNKFGSLLLSTGNKSEYAVGYATLYGDMCGGFAPIKDVYKTQVYELAKWRNANIPKLSQYKKKDLIPLNIITKAPTAELKENQADTDSLPPYDLLDSILYHLIEQNLHPKEIKGYDKNLVNQIHKMLARAEYKRKQSPLGTKVSLRDLSLDRRYPVANSYSS